MSGESLEGPPGEFALAFERTLNPILIADDQRRYVDANPAACLLLRRSRAQVLRLTPRDLIPSEHVALADRLRRELAATGTSSGRFELLMPDGERVMTEFSASATLTPGRLIGIFIPIWDSEPPASTDQVAPQPSGLTNREREVLARVALGETGQTIARQLHIAPDTVESHVRNTLAKLGAKNRPHAIALALQRGDLQMSPSSHLGG